MGESNIPYSLTLLGKVLARDALGKVVQFLAERVCGQRTILISGAQIRRKCGKSTDVSSDLLGGNEHALAITVTGAASEAGEG